MAMAIGDLLWAESSYEWLRLKRVAWYEGLRNVTA